MGNAINRARNFNDGIEAEALEEEFTNICSAINNLANSLKVSSKPSKNNVSTTTSPVTNPQILALNSEPQFVGLGNTLLPFQGVFTYREFSNGVKKYFAKLQKDDILLLWGFKVTEVFDSVTKFLIGLSGEATDTYLVEDGVTILDTVYKTSDISALKILFGGDIYFYLEGTPTQGRIEFSAVILRNIGEVSI